MFRKLSLVLLLLQGCLALPAVAGDFDWLNNLSIQAQADPNGFRARLATRFNLGDVQVNAVIDNVGSQADAYMVLRLAEMSHRPVEYVTREYQASHSRGWGRMARDLGIKPGSREFKALKAGHDLTGYREHEQGRGHGQSRGRDKHSHGHGHGHDHDDD